MKILKNAAFSLEEPAFWLTQFYSSLKGHYWNQEM